MCFLGKHSKFLLRCIIFIIVTIVLIQTVLPYTSIYYRFFIYHAFGLHFTEQDVVLVKGESKMLTLNAVNKRAAFSSSDFRVVYVNSFGKITALSTGVAIIQAKVDNKIIKCRVRVVSLNHKSIRLSVGDTKKLRISGSFFGGSYSSSKTSVVKVSRFGKLTAIGKGNAVITVTVKGKKLTCKVTVS